MHKAVLWKSVVGRGTRCDLVSPCFGALSSGCHIREHTAPGNDVMCRSSVVETCVGLQQQRYVSSLPGGWPNKNTEPVAEIPEPWLAVQHAVPNSVASDLPGVSQAGPVGSAMDLINGLHTVTGLPWWATLSLTALGIVIRLVSHCRSVLPCKQGHLAFAGIRAALFPLAVRQVQASTGLAVLWQQVRLHCACCPSWLQQQYSLLY